MAKGLPLYVEQDGRDFYCARSVARLFAATVCDGNDGEEGLGIEVVSAPRDHRFAYVDSIEHAQASRAWFLARAERHGFSPVFI